MTTSPSAPDERPEVPQPGVDAVPPLDREDVGAAQRDGDHAEVPSDAERTGTAEDEAEAARRHPHAGP
jgi:hypothetical protein